MRYSSIDIMRTIAIFVMVMVHFSENLSGYVPPFSGLGAPVFAILTGISYHLWVSGQQSKGKSEQEIFKVSVRRGLFVFWTGFAFNILVWLPEDTFNWDVLTFIGFGLLFLNLIRSMRLPVVVLIGLMAVLVSPFLRGLADYKAYWTVGHFECDLTLTDLLIGFTTTGYFPIFPWLAYPIAGYVTGRLVFPNDLHSDDAGLVPAKPEVAIGRPKVVSPWPVVFVGTALIAGSMTILTTRSLMPENVTKYFFGGWSMFPATIEYVMATIGMALALFGLAYRMVDLNPNIRKLEGFLKITKTFSRYSLTIYILHHIVHIWPLWIYGATQGDDPTAFWQLAMPVSYSLPLSLAFMACCYFALNWLGPDRRIGFESWMRWLCD